VTDLNVLGEELDSCTEDPTTGFLRDGHCRHLARDPGRHEVCAVMDRPFLEYTAAQGNDLVTPRPEFNFPGLEPGDRWCLCLSRWIEAERADVAPAVVLEATAKPVLEAVSLETLKTHAVESSQV
jgi:hypothetical protein